MAGTLFGWSSVLSLSALCLNHGCSTASAPPMSTEGYGLLGEPRPGRFPTIPDLSRGEEENNVCLTAGCVKAAATVLAKMNRTVDPCDDFYQFACGNYAEETVIEDDEAGQEISTAVEDSMLHKLRKVVTKPVRPDELTAFRMAKMLYKSCMDTEQIERKGLGPIKEFLKSFGGWPVLEGEKWNETAFSWTESVHKLRAAGHSFNYFVDVSVQSDLITKTRMGIYLDQASLGIDREYLVRGARQKIVAAYRGYMVETAVLFGADRDVALEELEKSLDLEISLARISAPKAAQRDTTRLYNPTTIAELQRNVTSVPWREHLDALLSPLSVRPDDLIVVGSPKYLTDLEAILNSTSKRVQANYVSWRVVAESVSYLTEELRNRQLKFIAEKSGRTEKMHRWKECARTTLGGFIFAFWFLDDWGFFNEEDQNNIRELVDDVVKETYNLLSAAHWMDNKSRANAMEKAKFVGSMIMYPGKLSTADFSDNQMITLRYVGLEVNGEDYHSSVLNITKFSTDNKLRRLRFADAKETVDIESGIHLIVNAMYSPESNTIVLTPGILQDAFFSSDRPRYMNYGVIGPVVGHEITHGFDSDHVQLDKDGKLANWTEETKTRYSEKASCIVHQYGNYTVEEIGVKLNGANTLAENISDLGGVKAAYYAYDARARRNGTEPRLPGLQQYTPRQMFWISAANVWCSKDRPESLENEIAVGNHSPNRFRVIGPFSNLEEFGRDFRCPAGSRMNPVHKCRVW